jgi:hypothetical protein
MTERLPIWLQFAAILCLVAVWIAVLRWVGIPPRGVIEIGRWRWGVAAVLYSYVPLAMLFLAVRFSWRFAIRPKIAQTQAATRSATEAIFAVLGVILMIGLFFAILFQPAIQRVREANGAGVVKASGFTPKGVAYQSPGLAKPTLGVCEPARTFAIPRRGCIAVAPHVDATPSGYHALDAVTNPG